MGSEMAESRHDAGGRLLSPSPSGVVYLSFGAEQSRAESVSRVSRERLCGNRFVGSWGGSRFFAVMSRLCESG